MIPYIVGKLKLNVILFSCYYCDGKGVALQQDTVTINTSVLILASKSELL